MADGIDFHQRRLTMLDNAIQVRRGHVHSAWRELESQISLGGDHRSAYLQLKLTALNIAVLALGDLGDQRAALVSEHGPGQINAPKRVERRVVQLSTVARDE
jgi:hypothetical protein